MNYNVIVIGAGSGGLVSAYLCAAIKAKVLLIEKGDMGGDCLNTGCVPSKALIRTTGVLSEFRRHREFGIDQAGFKFNFSDVMDRVQRVIKKVEPHDSVERYRALGVDVIKGEAHLVSPHEVRVNGKTYTTKSIIIATGAGPFVPPIPGLDQISFLTTENIWKLREQPKRLAVLGGGPIGCELSQCFARLGTQVVLVEMAPQLLVREDDEVIRLMESRFGDEGVELRLETKAVGVQVEDKRKYLVTEKDGRKERIEFDQLLVAVGRKPRTTGFGLEALGVKLTDRGLIEVDAYSRTSVPAIYACGDVASPYQFTHMAAHQAWYCAVNALFSPFKKFKIDWSVIPWVTYTDPEVARVGLNVKDAKAKGIPYEVTTYNLDDLDRAIADEEDFGLVKVLTVPKKDKIIGVTICGHHAGNLLPGFVYAMKYGLGLNKILSSIHAYPSMGEANKYAAGVWKKNHAPEGLLKLIEKYHAFRRR
jgi:dihydrolipoamide dehydrogenase